VWDSEGNPIELWEPPERPHRANLPVETATEGLPPFWDRASLEIALTAGQSARISSRDGQSVSVRGKSTPGPGTQAVKMPLAGSTPPQTHENPSGAPALFVTLNDGGFELA
jgi:hypothetical protein